MKDLADTESDTTASARGVRPIISRDTLVDTLARSGVSEGDIVIAHVSLSRLGWVVGGEQTMIESLRAAVGVTGTIVMPVQSWQLCDPDFLDDPAFGAAERRAIRDALPPFDELRTPSAGMGRTAELFRVQPDSLRSDHPHRSFAAAGPAADHIVERHDLADPVGEGSPLAALYDLDATILLVGVDHDRNTSLHLAEARSGRARRLVPNGARRSVAGEPAWSTWLEPAVSDDGFAEIGDRFAHETGLETSSELGTGRIRASPVRALVDFATESWRVE